VGADGTVSTLAGSGRYAHEDGQGAAASFIVPRGIAVDAAGTIYVADQYNHSVRKVTPTGYVSTLAGGGNYLPGFADGQGASARFNFPTAVAVDATGTVYVLDGGNSRIRQVTREGVVTTLPQTVDSGLAVDSQGTLYWGALRKIHRMTPDGTISVVAGDGLMGYVDGPAASARFLGPSAIVVDASGTIVVSDRLGLRKIR
jgi:streptogramin lyase